MPKRFAKTSAQVAAELIEFCDGNSDVTTQDLKLFCAAKDYSLPTINNRLAGYKVGRGKFNLPVAEAVEQLEHLKQDVVFSPMTLCLRKMTYMCHLVTTRT